MTPQKLTCWARFATLLCAGTMLLVAVASGCSKQDPVPAAAPSAPLSDKEVEAYQACTTDEDCVYERNGCCDCANGGSDAAINHKRVDAFRARFTCGLTPCTLLDVEPKCGSGKVACVAGKCSYTPP